MVLFSLPAIAMAQQIAIGGYAVPQTNPYGQGGITPGPDGAMWVGCGRSIGRITTAGAVTLYPLPAG
jgi:streptogramin lyase